MVWQGRNAGRAGQRGGGGGSRWRRYVVDGRDASDDEQEEAQEARHDLVRFRVRVGVRVGVGVRVRIRVRVRVRVRGAKDDHRWVEPLRQLKHRGRGGGTHASQLVSGRGIALLDGGRITIDLSD